VQQAKLKAGSALDLESIDLKISILKKYEDVYKV
jgi:hypothetical protein